MKRGRRSLISAWVRSLNKCLTRESPLSLLPSPCFHFNLASDHCKSIITEPCPVYHLPTSSSVSSAHPVTLPSSFCPASSRRPPRRTLTAQLNPGTTNGRSLFPRCFVIAEKIRLRQVITCLFAAGDKFHSCWTLFSPLETDTDPLPAGMVRVGIWSQGERHK